MLREEVERATEKFLEKGGIIRKELKLAYANNPRKLNETRIMGDRNGRRPREG